MNILEYSFSLSKKDFGIAHNHYHKHKYMQINERALSYANKSNIKNGKLENIFTSECQITDGHERCNENTIQVQPVAFMWANQLPLLSNKKKTIQHEK